MHQCEVVTTVITVALENEADFVRYGFVFNPRVTRGNIMSVVVDYPDAEWTDVTWQPDENMPTDPPLLIARGILSDARMVDLEADVRYAVMWSEKVVDENPSLKPLLGKQIGVTANAKPKDEKPNGTARNALRDQLVTLGMGVSDANALLKAGDSREKWATELKVWLKARPKKKDEKPK